MIATPALKLSSSSASRVIEKCRCGPLACPVRPTCGDDLALRDAVARLEPLGVPGEVAVVEKVLAARVLLVERDPAPVLPAEDHDLAVGGRHDRRALGGPDVDGQVLAVTAPRVEEGVPEAARVDALDGDLHARREQVGQVDVLRTHRRLRRLGTQERSEAAGRPHERVLVDFGHVVDVPLGVHGLGSLRVGLVDVGFQDGVQGLAVGTGVVDDFDREERPVEGRKLDLHPLDDDRPVGAGLADDVAGLLGRLARSWRGSPSSSSRRPAWETVLEDALDAFFEADAGSA